MSVTIAAIQMNSSAEVEVNLAAAGKLLREAADRGAQLAVLPENFALMGRNERDKLGAAEPDGSGAIQDFIAATAQRLKLWIVAGTLPLASDDPERVRPTCLVFDTDGARAGRYDKMHLFDVGLPDSDEAYRESGTFIAGPATPALVDTPWGELGLTVCYDLRFPELYRALSQAGADLIVAPSAFTHTTGSTHWHVLVRARAVENLITLIAPNQAGHHANGRRTYGHSLIVDPWGEIQAEAGSEHGEVVIATFDAQRQARLRSGFPALTHRRL